MVKLGKVRIGERSRSDNRFVKIAYELIKTNFLAIFKFIILIKKLNINYYKAYYNEYNEYSYYY